ncbi:hypothetical protein K443DRAFT_675304 [Laccaria amethystina LaAM-08-1]|uniref:DUF202 domain-containing protein n=1 Tax=Laccaria amethystina LaAM-08-1 TaxID=1095629 RepID=A0A0C9XTZ9_9AGAR|nr:hypothetical protein K443DRAFT_675304 [Laccaria amethystina LaAM-08-1]
MSTSLQRTTGQSSTGESAPESGKFIVETETSPLIQRRRSRPRQSTRLTGYVRRLKPGFTTRNIQLHLTNDGNVARDHLASERTFLAYVRTSLGIAAAGVALMQFLRRGNVSKYDAETLGATMMCLAVMVLLIGTTRYFDIQSALPNGHFPASKLGIALIGLTIGTVIAAILAILVLGL